MKQSVDQNKKRMFKFKGKNIINLDGSNTDSLDSNISNEEYNEEIPKNDLTELELNEN